MRLELRCIALLPCLLILGCKTPPKATEPSEPLAQPERLRARAQQLWQARLDEDWSTTYHLQEPAQRAAISEEEYVDWHKRREPFKTHAFELKRAQVDTARNLGWMEIHVKTSFRLAPNAPVQELTRWEKWRFTAGNWFPIPREAIDAFPSAPAQRDLAAEKVLRTRFDQTWQARQTKHWDDLYQLVDPRDRETASVEEIAAGEELADYLSFKLRWIEARKDRARIRVVYTRKITDPSLTKLPPEETELIEFWVRRDGEWYLDRVPDQIEQKEPAQ